MRDSANTGVCKGTLLLKALTPISPPSLLSQARSLSDMAANNLTIEPNCHLLRCSRSLS